MSIKDVITGAGVQAAKQHLVIYHTLYLANSIRCMKDRMTLDEFELALSELGYTHSQYKQMSELLQCYDDMHHLNAFERIEQLKEKGALQTLSTLVPFSESRMN